MTIIFHRDIIFQHSVYQITKLVYTTFVVLSARLLTLLSTSMQEVEIFFMDNIPTFHYAAIPLIPNIYKTKVDISI